MDYQRSTHRSRIPKVVQSNEQNPSHRRSCSAPSYLDVGYSTAIAIPTKETSLMQMPPKGDSGKKSPGQQDGTEDNLVQKRTRIPEEVEVPFHNLNSVRVIPPSEVYMPSPTGDVETTSIYSLDLPTVMSDQNEFALYPRFGKLNCLNLLHLQQHLYDLEQQLAELNLEEISMIEDNGTIIAKDTEVDAIKHRKKSSVSKTSQASAASTGGIGFGGFSAQERADRETEGCTRQGHTLRILRCLEGQSENELPLSLRRCKLMGEIELTLNAYNKALLNYSKIIKLPTACTRDTRALKDWLQRAEDPLAKSSEALRFLNEGSTDVIALCARESDILENFFQSRLLRMLEDSPAWSKMFPSIRLAIATIKPTVRSRAALEFLRFLISLGGALLIVAPVVVLYFTRSEWGRLMIICVCTVLFATMMHLFTASEKKEVLMATTGYTAVLVVFVGSEAFAGTEVEMPN